MARNRMIKHQFWTSEQIADCSPMARLLFIGLWNFCDDAGIHPASPKRLKMEIFPADDITVKEVEQLVSELISADLIMEYQVADKSYWQVTGWDEHQKIQRPTYSHPKPGQVPDSSRKPPLRINEDSRNNHGNINEQAETPPPEEKRREKKEKKPGMRDPELINAETQLSRIQGNSAFRDLKESDLKDTGRLVSWHRKQARNKSPVVNQTESTLLNVIAAAERALEHGTNPVALFAHIVGKGLWNLISLVQEDRARHRLRLLRSPPLATSGSNPDPLGLNLENMFVLT